MTIAEAQERLAESRIEAAEMDIPPLTPEAEITCMMMFASMIDRLEPEETLCVTSKIDGGATIIRLKGEYRFDYMISPNGAKVRIYESELGKNRATLLVESL